jgi:hypothetical protein
MKARRAAVVVVALLILVLPALAKENRSGAGFALNRGMVDIDFSATTDVDFDLANLALGIIFKY